MHYSKYDDGSQSLAVTRDDGNKQDVFDFLSGIGYSVFRIDGTELVKIEPVFPADHDSNYVFKAKL